MSNRASRRKDKKALPRYKRVMSVQQRAAAIVKNGITPKDVDEAYQRGLNDGAQQTQENDAYYFCAAIALALNDLYGFGKARSTKAINLAAKYMLESFTSVELVQEAYKRVGLEFADDFLTGYMVKEVEK